MSCATFVLAVSLIVIGCDQPLVVEVAPRPIVKERIVPVAEINHPADLARARAALDALAAAWKSPAAYALQEQGARARKDADVLAASLAGSYTIDRDHPILPQLMADAARAEALRFPTSPRP